MAFVIDKDHIAIPGEAKPGTNLNAVGLMGPSTYTGDGTELKERFKIYDDDGELYYEGRASSQSFQALDCFGTPNAGATEIRFYNKETRRFEQI